MMDREKKRKVLGFYLYSVLPLVFSLRPGQSGVGIYREWLFHSTFIAAMEIHSPAEFPLGSAADFGRVAGTGGEKPTSPRLLMGN